MGRPQSSAAKFRLLMWKNWTLQKRHKTQTVVELILPLVFTSLLVLIRALADASEFPEPSIYQPYSVDQLPNNLTGLNVKPETLRNLTTAFPEGVPDELQDEFGDAAGRARNILRTAGVNSTFRLHVCVGYTPASNITTKIMRIVQRRLKDSSRFLPNFHIKGFELEADMVDWLDKSDLCSFFSKKIGGVVFINPSAKEDFGKHISVKIRPHQQSIVQAFRPPSLWYTSLQFPPFQMLGPRNKEDPVGGNPGYYKTGFLALQHAVSASIAEVITGTSLNVPASVERVPYPGYINDGFLLVLQGWLPLVIMLSFIYPAINICKNVVVEKEKRLKESMKMMGLPNWIHWAAWWTKSFIMLFISITITTVMLCVNWYGGPGGIAVLSRSDPSVFFVFMMLFVITSIAFCFMISVFFSKANSGATAAGVLFFVLFLPYDFLFIEYDTLTLSTKVGACILSNTAMGFGGMIIAKWEGTANTGSTLAGLLWFLTYFPFQILRFRMDTVTVTQKLLCCLMSNTAMGLGGRMFAQREGSGDGVQWSNINSMVSPDDQFKMSHVFAMLIVDTILYLLITWYVEAVFPGEYGIPQKWYFPFTKHYWMGAGHAESTVPPTNDSSARDGYFEPEPTEARAGVQIRDLSKVFSNGKVAVNHVSLNMYEGQITALLGHNGAGKTTTMSMLVGLFPTSSGTALINGYDIRAEMDEVRSSLGICPQHDVLFDELTVSEHIQFFCRLKGFDGSYQAEIDKMLATLQLEDKRDAQSQTLSGGMKRKLSVGVALCGESKVVLLDEPTSGMDPSARRSTWELLQRERAGRTLLLTTHFMEEADLLGDRIAIMADGEIQCCGSSLFLKRKYGAGYHMVIVKEEGCVVERITHTIQRFIPDITYDQNIGAELSYVLPNEAAPKFEEMFTELDARREELKVSSYGASITTMEEVFIRVGEQSNPKIQQELKHRSEARNGSAHHSSGHGELNSPSGKQGVANGGFLADVEAAEHNPTVQIRPTLASVGSVRFFNDGEDFENNIQSITPSNALQEDSGLRNSGLMLFLQQLWAMLVKKAIHSVRNWVLTLVQIILPIFFLTMALLVLKSFPGITDDPPLNLKLENFGETTTPVWQEPNSPNATGIAKFTTNLASSTKIWPVNTSAYGNMTDYLLQTESADVPSFNRHYIVGLDISSKQGGNGTATEVGVTAFFNNQPFHAAGAAMVALDEVLLRYHTNDPEYTFSVVNHPSPISDETKIAMQQNGQSNGFNIAFNVAFGISFLAASFVLFLIKETSTKAKHLQFVSGVGIGVFWLSNLLWDYVNFCLPCIGMLLTLLAFNEEGFVEAETQAVLALLLVMYGYAMLPQSYLFSFLFTVPSSGFTRVTLFNIFSGMATMVTVAVLRIPVLDLEPVSEILDWVFMILPNYALGMGMADVYNNYQGIKLCPKLEFLCPISANACCKKNGNCGDAGCVYWTDNYLAIQRLGIGRVLLFMFAEGTVCLIILALIELRLVDRIKYLINNSFNTYGKLLQEENNSEGILVPEVDSDVAAEKNRILTSDIEKLKADNVLVIKDLTKFYSNNFLAVDRLCLAVPKGECFGLLGINGAGKTTTFKMLTGDELISWGDAFLLGRSVRSEVKEVHSLLGYCPQFDAVIDQMTGRETLRMFARLRGIYEADIEGVVDRLAEGLFLSEYIDKQVREYSGGNKRKLSTAVALVGDPPIVFLDEPTTGMDPVARRLLWDVICRIRAAGRSIILTSHSMEECEALCTRLAIMVNGEFRCMGSPQHLKSKFGQGYTLLIKVSVSDDEKLEFSKSHKRVTSSSSAGRQMSASVAPLKRQQSLMSPSVQLIKDFVEKSFPGSVLKDVHQGMLNYQITDTSNSWAGIFGAMERAKERLNIEDYSVGQTTLEQVFLNFARGQRPEEGEA